MATSPVPQWAREMSDSHRGPSARAVLFLAIVAVLFALWLQAAAADQPATGSGRQLDSPGCAEMLRLERHGVAEGSSYQRAVGACFGR